MIPKSLENSKEITPIPVSSEEVICEGCVTSTPKDLAFLVKQGKDESKEVLCINCIKERHLSDVVIYSIKEKERRNYE